MQRGAEAYHKGDFAGAAQTYAGMSGAEGQYNYGNALAKQGEYEQAIAAYDRALRRQPANMGRGIYAGLGQRTLTQLRLAASHTSRRSESQVPIAPGSPGRK